jgi:hypothetical protein
MEYRELYTTAIVLLTRSAAPVGEVTVIGVITVKTDPATEETSPIGINVFCPEQYF